MAYCTSCGSPIPDGQGKSCSMCYGDPDHGRDNYYRKWLEEQAKAEYELQIEQAEVEYERQREQAQEQDNEQG